MRDKLKVEFLSEREGMVYSGGHLIHKPWVKGESVDVLRWHISWTGWKESRSPDDDSLVGQWLAWDRRDSRYYYASVPGGEGEYKRGECFDIDPEGKPGQFPITRKTPLGAALEMYEEGYRRLLKVLETHGVDTSKVYEEKL